MMRIPFAGSASGRIALGLSLLAAVSCTHDFSVFDVSGTKPSRDSSASGAPNDAASASGGASAGGAGGSSVDGGQSGGASGAGGSSGGSGGTPAAGGAVTDSGTPSGGSAGASADAGPTAADLACDSRFGREPGYLRCAATGTTCRFLFVSPTPVACTAVCGAHRWRCIDEVNADPGSCVVVDATPTCASAFTSAICVCGR